MSADQPPPVVYEEVPEVDATTAASQMADLRDIALAQPASWRPQTAGWYVLFALAVAGLVWMAWRARRRWQSRAYRRVALAELDALAQQLAEPGTRLPAIRRVNELVKRVRLSAASRTEVAALSGAAWLSDLDGTWAAARFTAEPGALLADVPYEDDQTVGAVSDAELHALIVLVRDWIRGHRA